MAERSNIEWCDATFNPWIGCTKVSPACDHCYAERDFDLRLHVVQWGAGQARKRTGDDNWKKPGKWNAKPFFQCEVCGLRTDNPMRAQCKGPHRSQHMWKPARRRVFCASLADVFDNEVPAEWRADLFRLIEETPNLDWILLTKRVGNVRGMAPLPWIVGPIQHGPDPTNIHGGWPDNVWLGATICNQAEADRDIPKLLAVPAAVRFLSIEPMLGPVDIRFAFSDAGVIRCPRCMFGTNRLDHGPCPNDGETLRNDPGVHWVICGGESGPHARPMHPDWARSLRDQCAAARVPFLFKQWGEWGTMPGHGAHYPAGIAPDGSWVGAEDRLTEDCALMYRIGKKAAGRLLDGVEHNRFPEVRNG